jgi:2-polyprenyl-6-hydroxyphenyl methylase/3-demethylubiquinone-9 3-methyltransferase
MDREIRYGFGDNWRRFLAEADEANFMVATAALQEALAMKSLQGRSFLDIGSGSGVHSLAAHRMGAERIFSFDYDQDSVRTTEEARRLAGNPAGWTVMQGSILDREYVERTVPKADVVYSWGVLHHTGGMWDAIRNAATRCAGPGSTFLIGIYNKKKPATDVMKVIKRTYSKSGPVVREALKWSYWGVTSAVQIARGRSVLDDIRDRNSQRGMDYWRDLEDWVGGYPYECATPAEVTSFVELMGFKLVNQVVRNTIASVNEFRFIKS